MSKAITLPAGMKMVKAITLPVLVLKEMNDKRVVRIDEAIKVSTVPGKKGADGVQEKPANVCAVTEVESGEQLNFLVPAVVQKNLEEVYPESGYVGKVFYIENIGKRKPGQRYNDFRIAEVEVE